MLCLICTYFIENLYEYIFLFFCVFFVLFFSETKDLMARRKKLDPTNEQVKNDAENIIIRRTLVLELLGKIIHLGHSSYARKM